MRLSAGDKVVLSIKGREVSVTVIEAEGNTVVAALAGSPGTDISGAKVELRSVECSVSGRAIVGEVENTSRFSVVHLHSVSWATTVPRAQRHEYTLSVAADYKEAEASDIQRTIGRTNNLSISGVRVRLRSPMKLGSVARLVIRLGQDSSVEALGRVARIVEGSEASGGGYDIGFKFERILSGQDHLVHALNQGASCGASATAEAVEDDDDWFALPQAA